MTVATSVKWNRREIAGAVARYLKIGEGRPEHVEPKRTTAKTVKPQPAKAKTVRPKPAPTASPKQSAKPSPKPAPVKVLRCYDCDGEIRPDWEQCPHCALMLDPAA